MAEEQETRSPEEPVAASKASDVPDKVTTAHTIGSAISGASAGAVIGTMIGGPIGTVAGSIVGVIFGGLLQAPHGKGHPDEPDKPVESGKGGEE